MGGDLGAFLNNSYLDEINEAKQITAAAYNYFNINKAKPGFKFTEPLIVLLLGNVMDGHTNEITEFYNEKCKHLEGFDPNNPMDIRKNLKQVGLL